MKEYEEYEEINSLKKRKHSDRKTRFPKLKKANLLKIGAAVTTASVGITVALSASPISWVKKPDTSFAEIHKVYASEHQYSNWVVVEDASCISDGLMTRTCEGCGRSESKTIGNGTHHLVLIEGKESTCTQKGLSDGYYCDLCNETVTPQTELELANHTYNEGEVILKPTCTSEGQLKTTCQVCGENIIEPIEKTEHVIRKKAAVEATCTKDGYTESEYCKTCGEIIKEASVIAAKGHHYVERPPKDPTCSSDGHVGGTYCDRCGYVLDPGDIIPRFEHSYNWDAPVVVNPTCSHTGSLTYRCIYCGHAEVEELDMLEHWGYEDDGYCNACGARVY